MPEKRVSYKEHSLIEFVNHSIETLTSFATASFFSFASTFANKYHSKPAKHLGCIFGYISLKFVKDYIIEASAAVGHAPYFNQLAYPIDLIVQTCFHNGLNASIGNQESYNQFIEGSNKFAPLYIVLNLGFVDINTISPTTETMSSFTRGMGYLLYEQVKPNASYITDGHFSQEFELHSLTEAPILWSMCLSSFFILGSGATLTTILLEESTIETVKGLSFKTIDLLCPSCSSYKDELTQDVVNLLLGE